MRGCFVTGTDTGVGKTVLTAAIVAALVAAGEAVRPIKPVITGLAEPPDPHWPPDHQLLARVAGLPPSDIYLAGYGPAVSPHLAAELSGPALSVPRLAAEVRTWAAPGEVLVVEGVGGLLVPLGGGADVRQLAAALGLPLIVTARPGLGTINHTLLTLEAARAAGLSVAGVVLTPWPDQPGLIERSNRKTIAELGAVDVAGLVFLPGPEPALLARAGSALPLTRWLDQPDPIPTGGASSLRACERPLT